MSQVPNRYYNSPWIADAARNLSLAIAGDPERDAARLSQQHTQFEMDRQKAADARAADDRAKRDQALPLFSQLLTLAPDAHDERRRLSGQIATLVGPDKTLFDAMGADSPTYDMKSALAQQGIDSKLNILGQQIAGMNGRNAADNAARRYASDNSNEASHYNADRRFDGAEVAAAARLAAAKEAKDAKGKTINVSPAIRQQAVDQATLLGTRFKGVLAPETIGKIVSDSLTTYHQTGEFGSAFDAAVAANLGDHPLLVPAERKWLGLRSGGLPTVTPDPSLSGAAPAAPSQAMPPTNFSGALLNPGAQGASLFGEPLAPPQFGPVASGAPPQTNARPPMMNSPAEARAKLRSGDSFTTPDGRVMVLK